MSLAPRLARVATRSFHASPPARGGGGAHPPYPHHVWSPSGGWWSNPADWKRNSYIAGVVGVFLWGMVFSLSASIEVRAHTHRAPPGPPLFRGVLGPSRTRRGGKERALRTPRERARPRIAPPSPPATLHRLSSFACVLPPPAASAEVSSVAHPVANLEQVREGRRRITRVKRHATPQCALFSHPRAVIARTQPARESSCVAARSRVYPETIPVRVYHLSMQARAVPTVITIRFVLQDQATAPARAQREAWRRRRKCC